MSGKTAAFSPAEEYRSRWGARASNPLEGAWASSVGSTPASSASPLSPAISENRQKPQVYLGNRDSVLSYGVLSSPLISPRVGNGMGEQHGRNQQADGSSGAADKGTGGAARRRRALPPRRGGAEARQWGGGTRRQVVVLPFPARRPTPRHGAGTLPRCFAHGRAQARGGAPKPAARRDRTDRGS